ncbi:hypothetical protein [Clostridium sp. AWRP]|uniref:hypothetical protein n=1 Tax=Clostridium sp. AWRP TaxID=2212991 RepID=UPI0015868F16|nr:hypothetical protein [Clostridium sp. AWRP]
MKDKPLIVIIRSVKIKYLQCNDIDLKKYIGKVLAGDIDIKRDKLIENSKK